MCGSSGGGSGRGFRRFCGRRGGGGRGSRCTAQGCNQVALFDFVAHFDGDAGDGAGAVRRDFHRGFVGFQHDHGLAVLDAVARFDQDFDDIDGVEVTNVRYANFIAHYLYPVS